MKILWGQIIERVIIYKPTNKTLHFNRPNFMIADPHEKIQNFSNKNKEMIENYVYKLQK